MAIGKSIIELMIYLKKMGYLANKRSIIELGSQNLYIHDRFGVERNILDRDFRLSLAQKCKDELQLNDNEIQILHDEFQQINIDITSSWFYSLLGLNDYQCVDGDGLHNAYIWDLNEPIPTEHIGKYDVVTNHGTAEHVFNIGQVFVNIHDLAKDNAIIIHSLPIWGWLNHGFYNINPILIEDIATANNYKVIYKQISYKDPLGNRSITDFSSSNQFQSLSHNCDEAILEIALQKTNPEPFIIPYQGVYRKRLKFINQKSLKLLLKEVVENISDRELVMFGAGSFGQKFLQLLQGHYQIKCIYDNNASLWGKEIDGVPIRNPDFYDPKEFVFITSQYAVQIAKQLNNQKSAIQNEDFYVIPISLMA